MAYGKPGTRSNLPYLIGGGVVAACVIALVVMRIVTPDGSADDPGDPAVPADPGDAAVVVIPDDTGYPDAPESGEWETEALVEDSYVQVAAESTCMAQSFHGPPDELTREMDRIYFHYKTTALEVATFAAEINADDVVAIRVGERIAAAIERCP